MYDNNEHNPRWAREESRDKREEEEKKGGEEKSEERRGEGRRRARRGEDGEERRADQTKSQYSHTWGESLNAATVSFVEATQSHSVKYPLLARALWCRSLAGKGPFGVVCRRRGGSTHYNVTPSPVMFDVQSGCSSSPFTPVLTRLRLHRWSTGGYAPDPARLSPVVRAPYSPAQLRLVFPPPTVPL